MKEFFEAFRALRTAPRALWLVIFAFSFDEMAYFGLLPLMKAYLGQDIGVPPAQASVWVSLFTGAVSLVMLFVGRPVEQRLGIRRGILIALALGVSGRALYSSAPALGGAVPVALSLVVVAFAEGILQPVAYAGIKVYTDEKNGAMGYALLYALFNLAVAVVGPVSSSVRTSFDAKHAARETSLSGFGAVNWVGFAITAMTLAVFALAMTRGVEGQAVRGASRKAGEDGADGSASPLRDPRFLFFIFMLLPVRTLFAHQWLTMPEYVLRAYPRDIADRMEWLVDSVNPIVIFLGVPTLTAVTKRYHVLTMMIIGSAVTAVSPFLLVFGESGVMLVTYFVIFSVGEALWASRFYEYAAELAPEGRTAQYMGLASLPWFVAKSTTGLYSGILLERYVPKNGSHEGAGTMWLLYGLIALASPLGLVLARRWLLRGMSGNPTESTVNAN